MPQNIILGIVAIACFTPSLGLAQYHQMRTQTKNHPEACDRFEIRRFRNLETKFTNQEKRWFIDFNCPVG